MGKCPSFREGRGGKSLSEKVYEISVKTIGFLWDLYKDNSISLEGLQDFSIVIHPSEKFNV